MKKALSLILVLILSLSLLVSCGGTGDGETPSADTSVLDELAGKTTEQIFAGIVEESRNYTNYTMLFNTKIYYNDTLVSTQVDTSRYDGQNQHVTMTPNGVTAMEFWWVDDVYYLYQNGTRYKMNLTYEELLELLDEDPNTAMFLGYPVSWFENTVIKKENGVYFLDGTLNAEKFNERAGATMNAILTNIKFKVIITEEGEFQSFNLTYNQKTSGIEYFCDVEGVFTDIGTTVVTKPANPENFIQAN